MPRLVEKDAPCTCKHIFWQHYEDADPDERAEQPDMPEHGCAMGDACTCQAFTLDTSVAPV